MKTLALIKVQRFFFYSSIRKFESKAAYEASRPKDSTYKVDETDEVFNTLPTDSEDEGFNDETPAQETTKKRKKSKPNKEKRKKLKMLKEEQEMEV